jgi:hypothetical protein
MQHKIGRGEAEKRKEALLLWASVSASVGIRLKFLRINATPIRFLAKLDAILAQEKMGRRRVTRQALAPR